MTRHNRLSLPSDRRFERHFVVRIGQPRLPQELILCPECEADHTGTVYDVEEWLNRSPVRHSFQRRGLRSSQFAGASGGFQPEGSPRR